MKLKIILAFIIWFLLSQFSYAQIVSLEECVQLAIKQHPDYQEQLLNTEMADANLSIAKSSRLPQLGFQVNQVTNSGRSIDRFTNSYINQVYNSTFAQANLSQPVFMGFGIKNNIQSKAYLLESEKHTLEARKNNLTIQVIQAYLLVLQYEELSQTSQNQTNASRQQFNLSEKRFLAGIISNKELLQLKTQLAQSEFDEINAVSQLEKARLALFQLLNMEPNDRFQFKKMDYQLETMLEVVSGGSLNVNHFPELKATLSTLKAIDYQTKSIKSQNLPSLNFYAGWSTLFASSNPDERFFQQLNGTRNASFTLSLQIPVLGKFQTKSKIQASDIQHKLTRNQLEKNKLTLNQAYQTAKLSLDLARRQYENAQVQLEISEANMNMINTEITAGTNNVVDYILAKSNLERALSASIQSKYEFLLQNKIVNFYQTGLWDLD